MNKEQQIVEFQNDIIDNLFDGGTYKLAESLYNAGYRKPPEDSVVLSREEYDNLKLELQKAHNKGVQAGFDMTKFRERSISKQAVEEFAEKLKKKVHNY